MKAGVALVWRHSYAHAGHQRFGWRDIRALLILGLLALSVVSYFGWTGSPSMTTALRHWPAAVVLVALLAFPGAQADPDSPFAVRLALVLGLVANGTAIIANSGRMPVAACADCSGFHIRAGAGVRLWWLTDWIGFCPDVCGSPGDILIAVFLLYWYVRLCIGICRWRERRKGANACVT